MIKKIIIILTLLFAFGNTQAITLDEVANSVKNIWKTQTRVPSFSLTDINGKVHTDKSTGGKYLVVNFWATWCPPCLKEIPVFVDFYEENQDKVLILGLNHENADKDTIIEFGDSFLVNYPLVLFTDKNAKQFSKFGQNLGLPATYIYAPDGRLVHYQVGDLSMEDLQKIIPPKS